jgi:hypothetical protein
MIRSILAAGRNQFYAINWTLLALRTWTAIHNTLTTSIWASKKTYLAIADAFSEETYIFFKGDSTPYHSRHIILDGPGIPSLTWTFTKNKKTFKSSNATSQTHPKYLEWLSASIQYNGLNLYSLDDIIEGTQYFDANGTMPSNEILIAAWSLTSGIVLDKTIDLKLFIIHSDGHEETTSLWKRFELTSEKKKENEYVFPSSTMDSSGTFLGSRILLQNETLEVADNNEIPLTNGIPEADFEKVD